jgi:hypothetical protein
MTVKELKEIIKDLPDDMEVYEYDGEYIGYCDPSDYLGVAEIKVNGTKIKALVF